MTAESYLKIPCPHCGVHIEFPSELHGSPQACPSCRCTVVLSVPGYQTPRPPLPSIPLPSVELAPLPRARIRSSTEFAGTGCFVQFLALLLLLAIFWFPFTTIAGVLLFIVGSQLSRKYICGACGNPVASKSVRLCPACHAPFK